MINLLMDLYGSNFIVYFKSHVFHFNVQSGTFSQDHALLEEIYDFLWKQHDVLGELIRQQSIPVPVCLNDMIDLSSISCESKVVKAPGLIYNVLVHDIQTLLNTARNLYDKAEEGGVETVIGDYIRSLSKLQWKVKATLGTSYE